MTARYSTTSRSSRHIVTVWLKLFDAESRRMPYSAVKGRMYQPGRAKVVYEKYDDTPWTVGVTLTGFTITKAGKPGQMETDEEFHSWDSLPDWLSAIVTENDPAGESR